MKKISPALKKETTRVGIGCGIALVLMWAVFFFLHRAKPEAVPFDYKVILGGLCGTAVAVGNFYLMGLMVQRVTDLSDEGAAKRVVQLSQHRRYLIVFGWGILAILLPCFNAFAGIAPLLFPGVVIKILYTLVIKEEKGGAQTKTDDKEGSEA